MKSETRAFLECLGIVQPDRELPVPLTAKWVRRDEQTEHVTFDVGTFEPLYRNTQPVFDGEEVYSSNQLSDVDMCDLSFMGNTEFVHDDRLDVFIVKRKNVTVDRLPHYVKVDVVAEPRGQRELLYHNGG